MERLRDEYTARINRVLDYIEANIGEDLTLSKLAGIAFFSPYHFHRIFSAMAGESLYQFILRVRLEKAAEQLIVNPKKSILEIAFDCGFSGSATFARSFRDYFGTSASEWRQGGYHEHSKNRKPNSRYSNQPGKNGKETDCSVFYISSVFNVISNKTNWRIEMKDKQITANVEVVELREMTVAYIRHIGSYMGNSKLFGDLFGKLFRWAGPRGLIRFPETKMISVYHDNPDITEEDKLRLSVCLTIPPDTKVEGEIGMMTIPSGKYGVARFELKEDEYSSAWDMVYGGWLPDSGYQPDDRPCFEIYLNDPKQHPEGKHIVDICVPVKPL